MWCSVKRMLGNISPLLRRNDAFPHYFFPEKNINHLYCICRKIIVNYRLSDPIDLIHHISPVPKCQKQRTRKRKPQSAVVLTSSPYKNQLMERKIPPPPKQSKKLSADRRKNQTAVLLSRQDRAANRTQRKSHVAVRRKSQGKYHCHVSRRKENMTYNLDSFTAFTAVNFLLAKTGCSASCVKSGFTNSVEMTLTCVIMCKNSQ